MVNEHPFEMLFETLGRPPTAHASLVNRRAYELLHSTLAVPSDRPGRCILLRAPRAGHGKTHLLSWIQQQFGASHEFIPLHAAFGSQINASTVIDDSLRRLLRPVPVAGGLCMLDQVARRLFASALQPLVRSGEVPSQDSEGALTALRLQPVETFDFHNPKAITAQWSRENFEVLGQRLSVELARSAEVPLCEVAFWVDALFRFASTSVGNPARLRVLAEAVRAGNPGDGVMMERLEALLGLMGLLMRVVLVADELEGYSPDEPAALKLAAFVGSLRQSAGRFDMILSVNQDVWGSAFVPRLSDGLADRLSEIVVDLAPLSEEEMLALLESRVPGLGTRLLSRVDRTIAGTHARGLIRAAGIEWLKTSAVDSPSVAPVPSPAAVAPAIAPAIPPEAPSPAPSEEPETPDFTTALQAVNEAAVAPVQAIAVESDLFSDLETAIQPTELTVVPEAREASRVDELLRQFRQRYGSGST